MTNYLKLGEGIETQVQLQTLSRPSFHYFDKITTANKELSSSTQKDNEERQFDQAIPRRKIIKRRDGRS